METSRRRWPGAARARAARLVAALGASALGASACSMDAAVRRGRAFEVCDRSPVVEPWISARAEARRTARLARAIARHTSGTVRVRPLGRDEALEVLGQLPEGYGEGLVLVLGGGFGVIHSGRSD